MDFVGMWDAVSFNGENQNSRKINYWFKSDGSCEIEDNEKSSTIMEGAWSFSEQDNILTVVSEKYRYNVTLQILWYSKSHDRFKAKVKDADVEAEIVFLRTLIQ